MSRPERLLLVKERYLALVDYDVVQGDILGRLVLARGWVKRSRKAFVADLAISVSEATLKRKLGQLVDSGLVEYKTGRPNQYRVVPEVFAERVAELDLDLLDGIVVDVDAFVYYHDAKPGKIASICHDIVKPVSSQVDQVEAPVTGQVDQVGPNIEKTLYGQVDQVDPPVDGQVDQVEPAKTADEDNSRIIGNKLTSSKGELTPVANVNPLANVDSRTNTSPTQTKANVLDCGQSPSDDSELDEIVGEPVKQKTRKNRIYTWEHYAQFSKDDWTAAKQEGIWPGKENPRTLIIGAYLIAMKTKHKEEIGLVPADFGKYLKLAKSMLDFFTEMNNGDFLAGFNECIEWTREYTGSPLESYYGKAGYPINLMFQRDQYRQKGSKKFRPTGKRANDTGVVIIGREAREKAQRTARRVVDGRVQ